MKLAVEHIKRIRATLGPDDPRIEVQTAMPAFYVVPDTIEVEYNDEAGGDLLRVFKVEVHGTRYRRLKDGVKETGPGSLAFYPGTVSEFTGKMPAALHNLVRDIWWEGKAP